MTIIFNFVTIIFLNFIHAYVLLKICTFIINISFIKTKKGLISIIII